MKFFGSIKGSRIFNIIRTNNYVNFKFSLKLVHCVYKNYDLQGNIVYLEGLESKLLGEKLYIQIDIEKEIMGNVMIIQGKHKRIISIS